MMGQKDDRLVEKIRKMDKGPEDEWKLREECKKKKNNQKSKMRRVETRRDWRSFVLVSN